MQQIGYTQHCSSLWALWINLLQMDKITKPGLYRPVTLYFVETFWVR